MSGDIAIGTEAIEDLFQQIGNEALALAGDDLGGKFMVFAEIEPGVIATDLLYINRRGQVQLVLGPDHLGDLTYELWKQMKDHPGWQAWRVMTFMVEADLKNTIELKYPDQVDEEEDYGDRRIRATREYFGDVEVIEPDDPFA